MALLDILKTKKKSTEAKKAPAKTASVKQSVVKKTKTEIAGKQPQEKDKKGERFSHILIRPRVSEKAALHSGSNSYVFDVARNATKIEIKKAIKETYNVMPIQVNVINVKPKQRFIRGVVGKTTHFKKAIVFLKEGDSIELT